MLRTFATLLAVAAIAQGAIAGTVIISDGDFENSDWSSRNDGSDDHAGPQSVSGTQFPIGGAPGVFRELRNDGNNFGFGPPSLQIGWHLFEAETYDPSLGAIESLSFSEDALLLQGPTQNGRLALFQDGVLFRSTSSFVVDQSNAFAEESLSDLEEGDFEAFFNGSFFPALNPDFSLTGSEITFGVYREVFQTFRGVYDFRTGTDNFTVTLAVAAVPEPTSLLILLTSLLATPRSRKHA